MANLHEPDGHIIPERLARIERDVHHMSKDVGEMKESMRELVTRVEFTPIKLTVYGLVGIILAAVIGALVATVIRQ
jgi:hypothetical protein